MSAFAIIIASAFEACIVILSGITPIGEVAFCLRLITFRSVPIALLKFPLLFLNVSSAFPKMFCNYLGVTQRHQCTVVCYNR